MNRYPVLVRADRDAPLSRWLWLVKWLLLIPHYVVLAFLWVAFVALTLVAYVAVLFTGRYPRGIFDFNVGVLRWSWRVGYYGYEVLGTDRYPPFTLAEVPDYPADLQIDYPRELPHWLPLVAWLLAIPHLVFIGALNASGTWQINDGMPQSFLQISVVGAAVLLVGLALLFTGRPLRGLHDLLIGVGRWTLRVVAYVALLTGRYPPFRLDQGSHEPDDDPTDARAVSGLDTATPGSPPPDVPAGLPPAAVRSKDVNVAARIVALVAGVLVLLTGLGLGIGGAAVLALDAHRDSAGYVTSPGLTVHSGTAAITVEDLELQAGNAWSRAVVGFDDVRVTVSNPGGRPLFVGIGRQSDVDRWLTGTAHDQLVGIYGDSARFRRAAGSDQAVSPPTAQGFWVASEAGTGEVQLDWRIETGQFAVVVANPDGTPGVDANVKVGTRIGDFTSLGWGMVGAGAALALIAVLLIYFGASGLGRRQAPPPSSGPAPGPPRGQGPTRTEPVVPVGTGNNRG